MGQPEGKIQNEFCFRSFFFSLPFCGWTMPSPLNSHQPLSVSFYFNVIDLFWSPACRLHCSHFSRDCSRFISLEGPLAGFLSLCIACMALVHCNVALIKTVPSKEKFIIFFCALCLCVCQCVGLLATLACSVWMKVIIKAAAWARVRPILKHTI